MADPSNEVANPGTETYADKVEYDMDQVHNLSALKETPYGGGTTTTNFSATSMNEYTSVGGTTHTYDANGNLTDDGTYEYSYDFHNHLVKVVDKGTAGTAGTVAEYDYDCLGRGRRIKKVVGSDTTRFVYHGRHVIEELDGSDDLLRLFAYADGWDNPVMMEAADVADVDADLNTTEIKRFYYHTQLLGSITHVTDEDEVVVESYEYDAYGNTTIYDINSGVVAASQIENPYMYTARRMDEETGLYHYRARAYSPTLRRFIQRDPLEYVDGPNAFAYVRGRATRSVDPWGLMDAPGITGSDGWSSPTGPYESSGGEGDGTEGDKDEDTAPSPAERAEDANATAQEVLNNFRGFVQDADYRCDSLEKERENMRRDREDGLGGFTQGDFDYIDAQISHAQEEALLLELLLSEVETAAEAAQEAAEAAGEAESPEEAAAAADQAEAAALAASQAAAKATDPAAVVR